VQQTAAAAAAATASCIPRTLHIIARHSSLQPLRL
jgi:hypothetical protein